MAVTGTGSAGLERYGWDAGWEQVRAQLGLPEALVGRVGRVSRGHCVVLSEAGEVVAASDSQRSQAAVSPTTGDWVLYSEDPDQGVVIDTVLPRRTAIVRRDPAITVTKQPWRRMLTPSRCCTGWTSPSTRVVWSVSSCWPPTAVRSR